MRKLFLFLCGLMQAACIHAFALPPFDTPTQAAKTTYPVPVVSFSRQSSPTCSSSFHAPTFQIYSPRSLRSTVDDTFGTFGENYTIESPPMQHDSVIVSSSHKSFSKDDSKNSQSTSRTLKELLLCNINQRLRDALPKGGDALDQKVLGTAIPSMINMAVVPIVNSVDTFWVGRMGVALSLAGQAAANQAFFTLYFLINYLPTITAPLVASAVGSGNQEEAQKRVCESLFLSNLLGLLGTILLVGLPRVGLSMVLEPGAPALDYAVPYLRYRSLSMVPALVSATGFAAYRGMLNTVTPLKVSLATNLVNLILDPVLMFGFKMGFPGAALATALAETASGLTYLRLLLRKRLAKLSLLIRPPSLKSLIPLLQGGTSMLFRQLALNIGFVSATRRAQAIDPTGVAAAGYGIVMQIYSLGIVVHVAMQGCAAALVPATLAQQGPDQARRVADRIFLWGSIVGLILGITQLLAVPLLVPVFSTLPEVQEAVKRPALLAAILHVINGPVFAGEGIMLGLGSYRDLMFITAGGISTLVAGLSTPLGRRLDGIMLSMMAFCVFQAVAVVTHYLKFSPLAVQKES